MKINKLAIIFITLTIFSGCALVTDEYQANQRKVIAYLLEDLPLPEDGEIVKAPTVLLGTGEAISGRIILTSNYSPAENLIFYGFSILFPAHAGLDRIPDSGFRIPDPDSRIHAKNRIFPCILNTFYI